MNFTLGPHVQKFLRERETVNFVVCDYYYNLIETKNKYY